MKIIISLILTILISGCVGISNIKSTEEERKINLYSERGYLYSSGENNYTKSEVISLWGKPDDIIIKNNAQHWIYNREVALSGIFIWVILVPVPLIIPTGYRTTRLIFEKEIISKVIYEDSRLPTASCGFPNILVSDSLCGLLD